MLSNQEESVKSQLIKLEDELDLELDVQFYRYYYDDLKKLSAEEACQHWLKFGRAENRCHCEVEFYRRLGITKNDLPTDFNYKNYLDLNPDVFKAYGSNEYRAIQHFVTHGQKGGRPYLVENSTATIAPVAKPASIRVNLPTATEKKATIDARLIAFFLPQFHPIPENDAWWGKGFTEWTNVTKAQPSFEGHYQPHLPADMGFYDLRLAEVREEQAKLAKKYGIYGFCYYYYWFAGKKLLERPLEDMLASNSPDFPFCLCWANENWTRRWDGYEQDILMAQEHSLENNQAFAESLVPYVLDRRYIKIEGKPLIIIYRANILPDVEQTLKQWRQVFRDKNVGEVHLCAATTFGLQDAISLGFDSEVEFPPHDVKLTEISPTDVGAEDFEGKIYDYRDVVLGSIAKPVPDCTHFFTVMPSWDNTARKKKAGSIYYHSSVELYEYWLRAAVEKTAESYSEERRFVFVNAWNEWAEGAHLEPDQKFGHSYLEATQRALTGQHNWEVATQLLWHCPAQNAAHLKKLLIDLKEKIATEKPEPRLLRRAIEGKLSYEVERVDIFESNSFVWWLESVQASSRLSQSLPITGWLLGNPGQPTIIEASINGNLIKQIYFNDYRPDVPEAYPGFAEGNNMFSDSIDLNQLTGSGNIAVELRVLLKDGVYEPIGTIHVKKEKENILTRLKKQPDLDEETIDILNGLQEKVTDSKPVLFILHDIYLAGAQLFIVRLLEWMRQYRQDLNFEVLVNIRRENIGDYGGGGQHVLGRLENCCAVHFIDSVTGLPENVDRIREDDYSLLYVNTCVLGDLLESIGQIPTKTIVHVHELTFWIKYRLGVDKFRNLLNYNPKIIACSRAVRDNLLELCQVPAEQIDVIHAFVPTDELIAARSKTRQEVRQELDISEDTFIFTSCGTLDWRKGADLLMPLLVNLREQMTSHKFKFLWVGAWMDDVSESQMQHAIYKAGLEDCIIFTGYKTNPIDYVGAADAFILLSKEDPFPLVMLEAGICKLPVIGFEGSGGVSEFVETDAGFTVPYLNLRVMAEKAAFLVSSPDLTRSMGENACRKVIELYSQNVLAPKIADLVCQVSKS
jgi:glycosyltransferase involved in cell wall biosynthesis